MRLKNHNNNVPSKVMRNQLYLSHEIKRKLANKKQKTDK